MIIVILRTITIHSLIDRSTHGALSKLQHDHNIPYAIVFDTCINVHAKDNEYVNINRRKSTL